jgi:hypothetical protein
VAALVVRDGWGSIQVPSASSSGRDWTTDWHPQATTQSSDQTTLLTTGPLAIRDSATAAHCGSL